MRKQRQEPNKQIVVSGDNTEYIEKINTLQNVIYLN